MAAGLPLFGESTWDTLATRSPMSSRARGKLWIRVDADTPRDPRIVSLSLSLGTTPGQLLGHCVCVWLAVAEHCADGDMSLVTPGTVEHWAQWPGPEGFGTAFLATFAQGGVLQAFRDRNAKLAEQRDKERNKKRTQRAGQRGDKQGTGALSLATERNGTERNRTTKDLGDSGESPTKVGEPEPTKRKRRPATRSSPDPDAAPAPTWVQAVHDALLKHPQQFQPHGKIGGVLAAVVKATGATPEQLEEAVKDYDAHLNAHGRRPFVLANFATELPKLLAMQGERYGDGYGGLTARGQYAIGDA